MGVLSFALNFISAEFGRAFAGFPRFPWPFLMPCLILASLGALGWAMRTQVSVRRRGIGLLLFFVAMGCLTLAMGIGRGGRNREAGVFDHYAILSVPLLIWAYLVWSSCYGVRPVSRFFQMSLFVLMCVVFTLNVHVEGNVFREAEERFVEDVRYGLSASLLAERHRKLFWWQDTDEGKALVAEGFRILQRAGVRPFQLIRKD
jgi:hypothetical protein